MQTLASVRISQQRLPEAKQLAESAFEIIRDIQDGDEHLLPPITSRLGLARVLLELSAYPPALAILSEVLLTDDQDVEAWYLQGWCFVLISQAQQVPTELEDETTMDELRQDARNCLETCVQVRTGDD